LFVVPILAEEIQVGNDNWRVSAEGIDFTSSAAIEEATHHTRERNRNRNMGSWHFCIVFLWM